jgi:F-type H+-transporting ATPase subunit a
MPMEQFEIKPLIAPIFILFIIFNINSLKLIPNNYSILWESLYRTILLIIINNLGINKLKLFPLLFTIFISIFLSNLLGMIPYSATPSVELILTLSLAITILLGVLISGIVSEHGKYLTHLFLPGGTPIFLIPVMVILEIIAYLTRTFSLGLRLGVNIITGHILVKVCISFATNMSNILFILPLAFTTIFLALELLIAYLQAYIFIFIISITFKDILSS